eukprot:Gb_25851 [translate_table: standard]
MDSKDAGPSNDPIDEHDNDLNEAGISVTPTEDSNGSGCEKFRYRIKTLRSGKVIKVVNRDGTPLKLKTMDEILDMDRITISGARKVKITGPLSEAKSMAASPIGSSDSKSQSFIKVGEFDGVAFEGGFHNLCSVSAEKLGKGDEFLLHVETGMDSSSTKNPQAILLDEDDDLDTGARSLKQLKQLNEAKVTETSSSVNGMKKGNGLNIGSPSCHVLLDCVQEDNLSGQKCPRKRKSVSETDNMSSNLEESIDVDDDESIASWFQKIKQRIRLQKKRRKLNKSRDNCDVEENKVLLPESYLSSSHSLKNEEQVAFDSIKLQSSNAQQAPYPEQVGSSHFGSELKSVNKSMVGADCQQNLVESMDIDHYSLSEEKYCVDQHRSLSSGAKMKLFTGSEVEIREIHLDGCQNENPRKEEAKCMSERSIQFSEDEHPLKSLQHMPGFQSSRNGLCHETTDACVARSTTNEAADLLSTETLDMEDDCRGDIFQQPPAKLPSARKVISPSSQERLLQAKDFAYYFKRSLSEKVSPEQNKLGEDSVCYNVSVKSDLDAQNMVFKSPDNNSKGLPGTEHQSTVSPCDNKNPSFISQVKSPVMCRKGIRSSPRKQFVRPLSSLTDSPTSVKSPVVSKKIADNSSSGKQREEASPPSSIKGILKFSGLPCTTACKCDECVSIRVRAEKATEFSQRQMHDIDLLATRLVKELKTMRTIVEENLIAETDQPSTSSTFTVEKMRAATARASELEETSKRWLGMLSRDCNRYCKIVRSKERGTPRANNRQKQQRKIIFADEAGKDLCHVKLFVKEENDEERSETMEKKYEGSDQSSDEPTESTP